jgi:HD-GYP domain-containing protein (c-di-GMP phosphodiesterase class II)
VALHGATRAIRLYPVENAAVQKALHELSVATDAVVRAQDGCELRCVGDYLFINETRIRLMMDNYAAVANVLAMLTSAGIGGFSVAHVPPPASWIVLLSFLQSPPLEYPSEDRLPQLEDRLTQAAVQDFELMPPAEIRDADFDDDLSARERAKQTYARTLDVTRDVMTSARLGKTRGLKRVKRAVQGIVDAIIADSASMIGMTNLREFDDYTFVHSVNVCILSVALGRRLLLSKTQLLELGLAALMHDVGKAALPLELLNKRGSLNDEEREILQQHSWQGVLTIFTLPAGSGRPWRAATAAFEHHMRIDHSGYPQARRSGELSIYSKIIAVADGFDAATTARVYQADPWTPADVLRGMRDNPRLGLDQTVVKAFINLTGIYPTGTVVVLDTFEIGIVMQAHPDPAMVSRPAIRLISDAQGNSIPDAPWCDLSAQDQHGTFIRTIIRTESPERLGIRIADFFA